MKRILLLSLLLLPIVALAQYPTFSNKQKLGVQTTGDGLIYRGTTINNIPNYTPSNVNNAYFHLDTVQNKLYLYNATAWQLVYPLPQFDTTTLNVYLKISDTTAMLLPYFRDSDTTSLNLINRFALKLNISDTATMLTPYMKKADTISLSNRIDLKLNISDTTILSNRITTNANNIITINNKLVTKLDTIYVKFKDVVTMIENKDTINIGSSLTDGYAINIIGDSVNVDTTLLDIRYPDRDSTNELQDITFATTAGIVTISGSKIINLDTLYNSVIDSVNLLIRDSIAAFTPLTEGYGINIIGDSINVDTSIIFTQSDTITLSNRIDTKLNVLDTVSLSNRINLKLNKTDTINLSNRIDIKLNASDTVSLSNRINTKLNSNDTINLSNRINKKLDTLYINYPTYIDTITNKDTIQIAPSLVLTEGFGINIIGDSINIDSAVILATQQKQIAYVKNQSGVTMYKGQAVYSSGSSGDNKLVKLASSNTEQASSKTFGVVESDVIPNGGHGYIITFGVLSGFNTNALTEGSSVYLSNTPGELTTTKPQAPLHLVTIGVCIRKQQNNGSIFVKIQNGFEFDELHDVQIIDPENKASLYYNSSQSLWRDTTEALLVSDTSVFARDNQISGTSGQVAYFNSNNSVVSDTALRWSAANKSLGINMTTVPSGASLIIKNSQEPVRTTIVTNQTFTGTDTLNWTRGEGWTFNNSTAVATAATGALTYTPALTITSGNAYEITYTLSGYSAGTLTARIGNATYALPTHNATANVVLLLPTSASGGFRFTTSTFTGNLDNVSVVQISNQAPVLFAGQDDASATLYNSLRMPNSSTLAFGGGGANTTGSNNIANGSGALLSNTTGSNNVANGLDALRFNTKASNNIANGTNALYRNTTGSSNIANGLNALFANTTGSSNIANGNGALTSNTTGFNNVANGTAALSANTTGFDNVANGSFALLSNTRGERNIANGFNALYRNTTGSNNIANGTSALFANTTGSSNIANGANALGNNRTGSNNIANGINALYNSVLSDTLTGSNNIAIGTNAADNIRAAAAGNVAIGNAVDLPTNNGSNQGVYQNVLFFTGASGTGTTIAAASKAGIKTNAPNRDLEVAGEVRITDLTTDPPTRLVGADADGDLGQVTLGAGLGLASSSLLADTSFLVTRFDTASMLTNYLRTGTAAGIYLPLTGGTLSGSLDINTNNGSNSFQDSTLKVTYNQSSLGVNQDVTGIYSSVNTTGYTSTGILSEASTIYTTAIGVKGKATQSDINGPGVAYGIVGEIAASGSGSNGSTYAGYFNNTSTVGGNHYGLFVNTASGGDYGIYQTGSGINYLGSNTSIGGTLGVTGALTGTTGTFTGLNVNNTTTEGVFTLQGADNNTATRIQFKTGNEIRRQILLPTSDSNLEFRTSTIGGTQGGYSFYTRRNPNAENLAFNIDVDGNSNFYGTLGVTSNITGNSFIKSGGISTQFLKADGSVDANTYLTTSNAASTYLPLTGGTLTGALNGTTGTFSTRLGVGGFVGTPTLFTSGSGDQEIHFTHSDNIPGRKVSLRLTNNNGAFYTFGGLIYALEGEGLNQYSRMSFGVNTTEIMHLTRFSRVGIMNNSPSYTLDVNGTFNASGNSLIGGTFGVTGATTLSATLTVNSSAVFNEGSADADFRVESVGNANMVFVDASMDRVGIGYASPTKTLDVNGEVRINTVTATPTSLLGKDGSNVVGNVTLGNSLTLSSGTLSVNNKITDINTSQYTILANDLYIDNFNNSSTTIILPLAELNTFRELKFKNSSTGSLIANDNIIPLNGSGTTTTILPATNAKWCTLVSDGGFWRIMQSN
jgi:hypothetical protein